MAVLRASDGKLVVVGNRGDLVVQDGELAPNSQHIVLARLVSTPEYAVTQSAITVSEADGTASIQVTRSGATTSPVSIEYATHDGTGVAGTDFTSASGTLTWQPGDADAKTISIAISNNSRDESNKRFELRLSNPTEGSIATSVTKVTIADDDPTPSAASGNSGGGGGIDWLTLAVLFLINARLSGRRLSSVKSKKGTDLFLHISPPLSHFSE